MSNDILLNIDNVTKVFSRGGMWIFKDSITAINNVSLQIEAEKPKIVTLAGESGCGKSTLANMILGLIKPTSGEIYFKKRNLSHIKNKKDKIEFMKEVQPIFQDPFDTFNPLKRIDTYLFETARNLNLGTKKNLKNMVKSALELVGLSLQEIKGRYPHELSGGQAQRVSVARALTPNPSLLVADEPVSMVDASIRMSIVNLLRRLKKEEELSIIYITHDLSTAYYISDEIAIIFRGQIVEKGNTKDVLLNPYHPYTKTLKDSVPSPVPDQEWAKEIDLSEGETETEEFAREGCKFAGRCTYSMGICENNDPRNFKVDERFVKCHLYNPERSDENIPPWSKESGSVLKSG